jgi:hypothetical protein
LSERELCLKRRDELDLGVDGGEFSLNLFREVFGDLVCDDEAEFVFPRAGQDGFKLRRTELHERMALVDVEVIRNSFIFVLVGIPFFIGASIGVGLEVCFVVGIDPDEVPHPGFRDELCDLVGGVAVGIVVFATASTAWMVTAVMPEDLASKTSISWISPCFMKPSFVGAELFNLVLIQC